MEVKTTMRYHISFICWLKLKDQTSVGKDLNKFELLYIAGEFQNGVSTLESSLVALQNVKHRVTM